MKNNQPPKPDPSFDREREFNVVLEGIKSDFRVFGESLDGVKSNVDQLKTDFQVFGETLTGVKSKVDVMWNEMGRQKENILVIKTDVAILKTDVAVLKTDVAVLKSDVAILKTDVAELKSDMKEVKATLHSHDKRLAKLEVAMC